MALPTTILPVVDAMRKCGPMNREQIGHTSCSIRRWVRNGWLLPIPSSADGGTLYEPGPKADLPQPQPRRRAPLVDRTLEEGSDQQYVLGQLEHGTLRSGDLAELMDRTVKATEEVLRALRHLGYVEKRRCGGWALVKQVVAP